MLLKQQNWEQWQGAGISAGNWGVCQEAFSPAGGLSAPTPHLSYKHTQIAPPLLQHSPWPDLSEYLAIPGFPKPSPPPPSPQSPIAEFMGPAEPAEAPGQGRRPLESVMGRPWLSAHSLLPSLHPHLGAGWHLGRNQSNDFGPYVFQIFRERSSDVPEASVPHYHPRRLFVEQGWGTETEVHKDQDACEPTETTGHPCIP